MTTSIAEMEKTYVSTTKQRIEGSRFDWMMVAACTWLITGAYLDAWAHNHYIVILIAALAGVIGDVIYLRLQPSMARVGEFRLFAGLVPGVLYLVYFVVLLVTSHIVWSVHLSVGSIILPGITGWLISYLFIPLRDSMAE